MLGRLGDLEPALQKKGKRVKGTLKEYVDKFLLTEGGKVWASYGVTVDKAAESLLAEVYEFDTYTMQKSHQEENGTLVRIIRKSEDEINSVHYRVGKRLTALDNHLFEIRYVWKEINFRSGLGGAG